VEGEKKGHPQKNKKQKKGHTSAPVGIKLVAEAAEFGDGTGVRYPLDEPQAGTQGDDPEGAEPQGARHGVLLNSQDVRHQHHQLHQTLISPQVFAPLWLRAPPSPVFSYGYPKKTSF
jgi:hypothetical protein